MDLKILWILGILAIGIGCKYILKRLKPQAIIILFLSIIIGLSLANSIYIFIKNLFLLLGISAICGYLGGTLIYERYPELLNLFKKKDKRKKLLDTSIIIDGRITEIIKIGFLDGEFILPRFVLEELQAIADSLDSLKRNKGRRGLEVLKILKEKIPIHIEEDKMEEENMVDRKLIILAKKLGASILTCDYNLSKVGEIEGVPILNINELMVALKPIITPGETFSIQIVKEGKEFGQGLGYLEDGTMVIIENGSDYLGKKVKTEITNVLQSPSGRIIFAKVVK